MKVNYISPLVINTCIDFLKKRPIGTTYHPEKNTFVLDGKTTAKIIRHNGNLRARITPNEGRFFTQLIKHTGITKEKIESTKTNDIYAISPFTENGTFSIKLTKMKKYQFFKGRKPKFGRGEENVPLGES